MGWCKPYKITQVLIEKPFYNSNGKIYSQQSRLYQSLIEYFATLDIPLMEIDNTTAKKALGNGRLKKEEIVNIVKQLQDVSFINLPLWDQRTSKKKGEIYSKEQEAICDTYAIWKAKNL
jgi:hypothetical protein